MRNLDLKEAVQKVIFGYKVDGVMNVKNVEVEFHFEVVL